jgi:hypothetical protein
MAALRSAPLTPEVGNTYLSVVKSKEKIMSKHNRRTTFAEIITIMGDALAAAASVRQGRQPDARNLRGLGIDPEQFRQIGRL